MLEIPTEEVETTLGVAARHVSIWTPPSWVGKATRYSTRSKTAAPPKPIRHWNISNRCAAKSNARSLTLTHRQCDVIKLYFGIGVEHPMSLEDIGDKFGLTRERVRQIKDKVINKWRGPHAQSPLLSTTWALSAHAPSPSARARPVHA